MLFCVVFFFKPIVHSQPVFVVEMKFFACGTSIFSCCYVILGVFFLNSFQCFGNNSQYEEKKNEMRKFNAR